jgi:hypothetical protein
MDGVDSKWAIWMIQKIAQFVENPVIQRPFISSRTFTAKAHREKQRSK